MIKLSKFDQVILGSGSPRRQALLSGLDIAFTKEVREIDESFPADLPRHEVAEYLAKLKAEAWSDKELSGKLLLTADTVVVLDEAILGKPQSAEEGKEMLRRMSGKMHLVYTGVCLRTEDKLHSFTDKTEVHFKPLSEEEIEHYITKYKPFDKAGSYGAQEFLGYIAIQHLNGSYFNVMGLPVHRVWEALVMI